MNNKNFLVLPVLLLLAVFVLANTSEAATPNFNTGLGVSSGYKINFVANSDGVTWTNGTGGSINAANYTGNASSSSYALTAGSVTNASTANALAANGSNCTPGNYPLGIDAAGNVEGCTGAGGGSLGGSGTINYISKWSTASTLTNSLLFDNATNVGIGLTNPGAKLDVNGGSIRTTNQLISTVAAGTAPLAVTSNTLVSNLNADFLDCNPAAALSVFYAASAGSATNSGTSNALAANGSNCTAGNYPLGIDEAGNVESCTLIPAAHNAVSLAAIGSTPNANGMTLSTQQLNLQPANASFGGVVTTGAQTFAGAKTFNGGIIGALTGNASTATTAGALTANGTNCTAGNYPLGIDAAGNAEACTSIPGGISGSGTLNYVAKWSGATGLTNSLIFDNATNVGIGTAGPGAKLDVSGGSIRTTNQLISTVAAGTAPLAVTSNTLVTNLNADLLDGNHAANLSVLYATSAGSATSALTANALAGNGANCSAGYYPLGIDDKGDVESCTADLGADNLGDHVLTQNIITHSKWISGDGDDEGLYVNNLGAVAISTSSITTTLNLGGRSGVDGIKFPDGTTQTTAFTDIANSTVAAANVSAGTFGANTGGGNYIFPRNVGVGVSPVSTFDVLGPNVTNLTIREGASQATNPLLTLADSSGTSLMDISTNCGGDVLLGLNAGGNISVCGVGGTIFLGKNAGQDVSSGAANVFVGLNSGMHITTGNYSVAVGYGAGSSLTGYGSLSNNTAVGAQALATSGGGNNTGVGYRAGFSTTSGGTNNSYFGYMAGSSVNNGSNNIVIGGGVLGTNAMSNTLVIDNSNTSPALIVGDLANNRLGINTVSVTTYTLNVGGSVNATSYYANGTQGATRTVTVRNQAGTGTCNLVFTNGLYTSTTCP